MIFRKKKVQIVGLIFIIIITFTMAGCENHTGYYKDYDGLGYRDDEIRDYDDFEDYDVAEVFFNQYSMRDIIEMRYSDYRDFFDDLDILDILFEEYSMQEIIEMRYSNYRDFFDDLDILNILFEEYSMQEIIDLSKQ